MRTGVKVTVTDEQRRRLETIAADGNSKGKHICRARIVLLMADGLGTMAITNEAGASKPTVWRWQRQYMEEGVEGLLRDKTRKSGNPPTSEKKIRELLTLALGRPPDGETHWTVRALAKGVGIGRHSERHRHQEFIAFFDQIDREVPVDRSIHAILDNYSAHKHQAVMDWLKEHRRGTFRFWMNAVEGFFGKLVRCQRGVHDSIEDLERSLLDFIYLHNEKEAKPFRWTASLEPINFPRLIGDHSVCPLIVRFCCICGAKIVHATLNPRIPRSGCRFDL